jgi:hypothetical protein
MCHMVSHVSIVYHLQKKHKQKYYFLKHQWHRRTFSLLLFSFIPSKIKQYALDVIGYLPKANSLIDKIN